MHTKVHASIEEGKKLVSSPVGYWRDLYREWLAKKETLMFLGAEKDTKYNNYLKIQVKKTVQKKNKNASFRYEKMISELLKNTTVSKEGVLCVGCRNSFELDAFEKVGFTGVKGIDIQSNDLRIAVMDMGKMSFGNNVFNVVYSGDALEHAYDVGQAVSEFCRVVKPGGYIAIVMPINYVVNDMDRWDFKSVKNLQREFEKNVKSATVIWQEITANCIKVIFRLVK